MFSFSHSSQRRSLQGPYSTRGLTVIYAVVIYAEICTTFGSKVVQICVRNTKVYKIREICWAISSAFYNISRPNFAILLILRCFF